MGEEIKISVRELMEYVYKGGSIDNRFRTSTSLTEGTAIHQAVQKEYLTDDKKEVPLRLEYEAGELKIVVHGRCDGLLQTDDGVVIDEIKSTSSLLENISIEDFPVYWAQAKGYAYIYAKQEGLKEIRVQLTYVQKKSKEKKRFLEVFSMNDLEIFFNHTIDQYMSFAKLIAQLREKKEQSIPKLKFPFPKYREGQRHLAGAVYRTIQEKRNLYAQAPTGIGKTMSSLFPAIKALENNEYERIFYLTAKTVTRLTAEESLLLLEKNGVNLRSVTITAKDKICFKDESICQPEHCEFAEGYYDRINGAMVDVLRNETQITREVVENYARKHKVCPFEFSLDLTDVVDVIIGDYNYIFDPRVSLKRLLPERKKKTALLIDEAHNLVERAREMYSAEITKNAFWDIEEEWSAVNEPLTKAAKAVTKDLAALGHTEKVKTVDEISGSLEENLERFTEAAELELKDDQESEQAEALLERYFSAQNFLKILMLVDDHYKQIVTNERDDISLKLFCLDPSEVLKHVVKPFRASVFFSATLSPFAYYKDMLGGEREDYILRLPSPYHAEQIEAVIAPISTRYKNREQTAEKIAERLYHQVKNLNGNHLFFFPSYQYMQLIYDEFQKFKDINTVEQEQGMTEERRDDFLAQFVEGGQLVGFAVLGGVFSEGVDLRGNRLNGVAVVGIGLAPRSFEKELIKDYFIEKGKNGYDYAYVFPGMNKVLQAGGRLIRSENDHGIIQLIDDRFLTSKYIQLLPEEWKDFQVVR
ncbi:helicase C-terminal domain-containing protein [Halobacillus sp. Marseille-Q1614]|uniref:helicase C-terminal domain-containing protein n=1 Tax=Halobacillus sp. Marseille-Q1614 TaxID=2709134 RepID=UPI00156F86FB|nr:helicase C-terminal domain-containing protein [Halobacillus sp. Marseille-Q1614]